MSFQVMLQQLSRGFGSTLMIFCLTLLFSLPLGLVIYFGRVSRFKPLSLVVKCYISVMRGTPLMLAASSVVFRTLLSLGNEYWKL